MSNGTHGGSNGGTSGGFNAGPNGVPHAGSHTDLFSGLARKALQTAAIRPRLPSRFESPVAMPAEVTTGAPDIAVAPAAVPGAAQPSGVDETGRPPGRPAEPRLNRREPGAALADGGRSVEPSVEPAGSVRRAASRSAVSDDKPERLLAMLAARPGRAAAPVHQPLSAASAAPAAPVQGLRAESPARRANSPAPAAPSPESSLRARIVQQVPRWLDEGGGAPLRSPQRAAADPLAVPAAVPYARPATPNVEITIGSIDILLTQPPVAALARATAPAAGPAVQSLDAYLQARQRRGGA